MLSDRELSAAIGGTAYGPDGDKIGTVEHFFVDDRTGEPTWVAVSTGFLGTRHSVVPADRAAFTEGSLHLPVTREAVRTAPSVGDPEHLDPGEEALLREHYDRAARPEDAGTPDASTPDAGGGASTGTEQAADGAMIRSEERLRVSTEQVPATRVRVVRYVVTEEVQVTVPVRREEIRIEEVPFDSPDPGPGEFLTDAGGPDDGRHAAPSGGGADATGPVPAAGRGLPEEIVLHREEPVVTVRVVPAERVRVRTEVVAGVERVSGQIDREQIAVDQTTV